MLKQLLNFAASLITTLVGLGLFALGIGLVLLEYEHPTLAIAPGFLILLINLICAILVKEKIRRNNSLLVFHLSLLTLMLLIMASRLTYMKGWLQVNEGETFQEITGILHQGPYHINQVEDNAFRQLNYQTHIEHGSRTETKSYVAIPNTKEPYIIRDQTPLKLGAYQFTLSAHIGYSLSFNWQSGFSHHEGFVRLPAYSRHTMQTQEWLIPNTEIKLNLLLDMDTDSSMQGDFKIPERYQLIIFHQQQKIHLKVGESYRFDSGILTFQGLKRWIGYDVFYDWSIPWLLATCLLAIASLGSFLWQKVNQNRWDD